MSQLSPFGSRSGDFESFNSLVDRLRPTIRISKQMVRKVEGIELIRLKRDQGDQNLCFTSRPFVLCVCRCVACRRISCFTNDETDNLFCKSRATRNRVFPSARIVLFRFSWRPWPCGNAVRRSSSEPPLKCSTRLACIKAEKSIVG